MGQSRLLKRYRINPVESVLAAGLALLFCQSLFSLIVGYRGIESVMENHPENARTLASVRSPIAAAPVQQGAVSVLGLEAEVRVDCEHEGTALAVVATSVKITGSLCRAPEHFGPEQFHAEAIHLGTGAHASVKLLTPTGAAPSFSSDSLPLSPGVNSLRVELIYPDGTQFSRNIQVTRE